MVNCYMCITTRYTPICWPLYNQFPLHIIKSVISWI